MSDNGEQLRRLVDAAREGDDVAVQEFVHRTQPVIWRLCKALGSDGEADDLVQDTYLRALRSLSNYRGDGPVMAWLSSIARRVCADHVRGRVRQRRLVGALTRSLDDQSMNAPGNPTHDLLTSIDQDRREAFVLTQVAGLTYEEAAVVLDCPIGTIRSRVARARADLLAEVRAAEAS
ncbi:MAG TPA: sigma-70 family RNA polymerase sigma factor [Ilumatobacteraceae bacterium]|nr:sigma-70 family RNA polymerase sigma factor [Ilumatobacteraceae bacterium]